MNVSSDGQRVPHAMAQGGAIRHNRDGDRITAATCFTREGRALADFNPTLVARLKRRDLIGSRGGRPYRISPAGLRAVRAQLDNR